MKSLILLLLLTSIARAEPIGEVDTVFQLLGPDHKIIVDAHDDPKVGGITCYIARAKTGGIKGGLGLAEDKSEASIACRQVGPISFARPLPLRRRSSTSESRWYSRSSVSCGWSTSLAIRSSISLTPIA